MNADTNVGLHLFLPQQSTNDYLANAIEVIASAESLESLASWLRTLKIKPKPIVIGLTLLTDAEEEEEEEEEKKIYLSQINI